MSGSEKRQRVTLSTVKQRGWTEAMVREVLGEPDATAPNPHYRSAGAPMRLYYLDRVVEAETTEEFAAAKAKAERRRRSSLKGRQAARAVRDAEAVLRAEADRAAIEHWAGQHKRAALSDDTSMSMRDRREHRRAATHNEVHLAAAVDSAFALPPDPFTGASNEAEDLWHPSHDRTHISKGEVRRRTGWTTRQIGSILGEPDKIVTEPHRIVLLYSAERVAAAQRKRRGS